MSRKVRTKVRRAARGSRQAIATTILIVAVIAMIATAALSSIPATAPP